MRKIHMHTLYFSEGPMPFSSRTGSGRPSRLILRGCLSGFLGLCGMGGRQQSLNGVALVWVLIDIEIMQRLVFLFPCIFLALPM